MKKFILPLLLCILMLVTGCSQPETEGPKADIPKIITAPAGTLKVHFIDVGQADAILVQNSDQAMLVDAGNNADGELMVRYLNQQGIKKLQVVIGTHPHEDHIGGMDDVIKHFSVEQIYLPKVNHATETYQDVLRAMKAKNIKATAASGGQSFTLGDARVEILAPNSSSYEELNDYSIVSKISFGETAFLLTGDAGILSEQEMITKGYDLRANVLKVGHHGSYTATGEKFLKAVNPQVAVISVAAKNDYGHPHREILERLKTSKVEVYQTAQQGTLVLVSDGKKITVENQTITTKGEVPIAKDTSVYVDKNAKGLIKGNINKNGDKIYHLPGQRNYEQTKPEAWFKTEDEAVQAGFRRASR
ncbi:ComEC/Rec2 family competence protein [Desulfotomaculum sp. 1211_IL3151]|uniref:ComEC/Rec2 family competence protein n=1 Tax=Desulfotomaculum sp. 1211_IL3151 TaxID=3084055 RepID=UPI002FDA36A0